MLVKQLGKPSDGKEYIQEFTGDTAASQPKIDRITEQGKTSDTQQLRIIHWREVPL